MDAKVLTQTGLESWMGNGRAGNGTAPGRLPAGRPRGRRAAWSGSSDNQPIREFSGWLRLGEASWSSKLSGWVEQECSSKLVAPFQRSSFASSFLFEKRSCLGTDHGHNKIQAPTILTVPHLLLDPDRKDQSPRPWAKGMSRPSTLTYPLLTLSRSKSGLVASKKAIDPSLDALFSASVS